MQMEAEADFHWAIMPPEIVSMTMTSRCNLRCVMCDHGIRNVKKEDFKPDLVDMAGDFIASASLVALTGLGEPMLSDLFWNILQKFPVYPEPVDSQFFLSFNSNGTLLNERNIERVLQSRVRKIRISLDSADGELYRKIRGTDLVPIVDGVRALVRERNAMGRIFPKIGVEMTLMRANLGGVCDMIDLCAEIGVDFLEVWTLNHVAEDSLRNWKVVKGDWTFDYAEQMVDGLPKAVLREAVDRGHQRARERGMPVYSLILGEARATGDFPADAWQLPESGPAMPWKPDSIRCDLPWKLLRVTYDGDVFACCWGPRPIGNLRTQTLESIWNSVAIREMRSDLMAGVIPDLCSGAACHFVGGRTKSAAEWRADPEIGAGIELAAVPVSYEPDAGLYDLERYEGRPLRWTNGAAEFRVSPLASSGPMSLLVKLWNLVGGTVAISVNDENVLFTDLPPGGLETSLDLGTFSAETSLVIRVDSTLFESDGDPRQLGVAIESLRLVHQTRTVPSPSSQQAIVAAM
jgi:MoaA/NifB/PqqE/SkfB family radical SAM enzyme